LDNADNLGIGTANPVGRTDTVSNATAAFVARASTTGANQTVNAVNAYNADASLFALAKYNAVQHIWGYNGTTEGMRLDSSGNLGIGTASPVAKLSVQDALVPKFALQVGAAERAFLSYTESTFTTRLDSDGPIELAANNAVGLTISTNRNVSAGVPSLATTATDGFLYVPTCAGVPTGTPTAVTGMVPIVVDTTNNRWYFYSGGAWRNAGP
jgi:hypothetical protein